jgi:4'-phosphopantetheinyl transferase
MDVRLAFASVADLPAHDGWLSARERAVLAGLTVPKRARDWRLGRWVAKHLAGEVLGAAGVGIEVLAAADGAPELHVAGRVAPCSLSISHSAGLAMAALGPTDPPVGCDLERVEPRSDAFIDSYLTPSEAHRVRAASPERRPLLANATWCAKECVLKASRDGLRRDTRSVEIELVTEPDPDDVAWRRFRGRLAGADYHGLWRAREGWVQAVACGDRRHPIATRIPI